MIIASHFCCIVLFCWGLRIAVAARYVSCYVVPRSDVRAAMLQCVSALPASASGAYFGGQSAADLYHYRIIFCCIASFFGGIRSLLRLRVLLPCSVPMACAAMLQCVSASVSLILSYAAEEVVPRAMPS